jgi:OHCU decarboxylase
MDTWQAIDRAAPDEARRLLARACGSAQWVDRMLARRPFGSRDAVLSAADQEWHALAEDDWREAFTHHPKIGDRESVAPAIRDPRALRPRTMRRRRRRMASTRSRGNRDYERKFGYIFIVCAAGRSAGEMLATLTARLANDPAREIRVAAAEQATITALRLA